MSKLLHIINGDAFGDKLRASGIDGDILVWRESLYEGPICMQMSDSVLLPIRAAYMNRRHGIPEMLFSTAAREQEEALDNLSTNVREVVLWFEHDLYDQLMLNYLLSRMYAMPSRAFQLFLLNIGEFPGIDLFYGLGQLTVDQIRSLHHKWEPVQEDQLRLAYKVWTAYSASEPLPLASLIEEDLSLFPFLKKALQANYDRYPSKLNGLNAIQQLILTLLAEAEVSILQLFHQISKSISGYGLGDLQFWSIIEDLRQCEFPLVQLIGGGHLPRYGDPLPPGFENWRVGLTEWGILVLGCERDHLFLNGIDDWIGGVHLLGKEGIWRQNTATTGFLRM
ncbi:DUF1835 domain-containing protein [Paenibacillus ferrarius]|uniref:DUF1835 domain-containing protein n=1 Tax=Paenibacillus ferrarius TaxID=1469647 RepID=UPI0009A4F429|nr:DUF1835 domain-containing protein [Paenibacillus ferrarius]